jgi:nitrate/nitrite transporter NarK
MTALTLLGSVGAVVFASADGVAGATLGRVLLGVGMAGNLMGTLKLVADWFSPSEFATLSGVIGTLGALGNILATTPLAVLVSTVGWRRAFLIVAVATALAAIAFWLVVRDRSTAPSAADGPAKTGTISSMAGDLLRSRDFWLISFGAFCRYGTFVAIQGLWAGPYLVTVAGLSSVQAANFILLMNLAGVVGGPLGGWLSDRVLGSRKRVMMLSLAGTGLAQLALALAPERASLWIVGIVLALLGMTSAFGQVVYAHVKGLMPDRMTGMAMTGVNFFVMLGAGTFLLGIGWILDHGAAGAHGSSGYRAGFGVGAAATAVALVLYTRTRDAHVRRRTADG